MSKKILLVVAVILTLLIAIQPTGFVEELPPADSAARTLPQGEGFEPVSENQGFALYLNKAEGVFAVYDKAAERFWYSSPEERSEESIAKGIFKMSLFSLITLQVIDLEQDGSESLANAYTESILSGGASYSDVKDGFLATLRFVDLQITVPLIITLTEHGLAASVETSSISEEGKKIIRSIRMLPYFGAGSSKESGYILVPDGCGSLIYFNNGKTDAAFYDEQVYGGDRSVVSVSDVRKTQTAYLPVFGIQSGESGFLSIITAGAADSTIHAEVSGKRTSYNAACAVFTLRNARVTEIGDNKVTDYEKNIKPIGLLSVEYRFCNKGYSGMAGEYRDYLRGLRSLPDKTSADCYITLVCSLTEKRTFIGIPYNKTVPLTTFSEAQRILEDMKNAGVGKTAILLEGWSKTEVSGKLSGKPSAIKIVGGNKGLDALETYAEKQGIPWALNVNLISYSKGGLFGSLTEDARNINNVPIARYAYKVSTYMQDPDSKPLKYLSPSRFHDKMSAFIKSFSASKRQAILLEDITSDVYADYRKDSPSTQSCTEKAFSKGLEDLCKEGFTLFSKAANGYALPYLSDIVSLPVSDSLFDISDQAVPFYQLAINGLIGFGTPAANLSSKPHQMLLKALETGGGLHYILADDAKSAARVDSQLYSLDVSVWMDTIISQNAVIQQRNAHTGGTAAVFHEKLAEGVFMTTYENGSAVIVNYSEKRCATSRGTVEAGSYLFV